MQLSRDNSSLAAAKRDQRDDDVLLVVEVADKRGRRSVERVGQSPGVIVGGRAGSDRVVEGVAIRRERLEVGVHSVMVAIQQIDAGGDARLDLAELREVVAALDAVMAVQMLEEVGQRRQQAVMEGARVERPSPVIGDNTVHGGRGLPETLMHLKPESGLLWQGVRMPAVAGQGVPQI